MPPIHSARPWIYCKKPGFFFWIRVSLLLWISLCIPTLLPLPEAKRLGKELHHYAIDNNDHLLSDEYMRLLWIREELAKKSSDPGEGHNTSLTDNLQPATTPPLRDEAINQRATL